MAQTSGKENSPPGDPVRGAQVFKEHCAGCHDIESSKKHRAGPYLMGLWGREANTVPGFPFRASDEKKGIVWDDKTINAYLDDPHIPGTKMIFRDLKVRPGEKADLIAYLKKATKPKTS